ncbi:MULTISPECIES: DsbA family protein [Staphylococcus]|jgi:putative lipoprotein|nr:MULTISPECIES: DsbA family protein [Staphylococcus]AKL92687.1 Thiol-disulfide oxidoreductase D [Staphylococcus capitis subsp. capitis]EFS16166.1 putative glutaredoxin [Staphylococcus capitis C87]MBC3049402.1 DsbA family protein [Staphylococcus capitis]MBC3069382.1 DsbA family protein [Staphylococcus capitis]MBC3071434.1 DsbA family protein [Staphylococcus capitis]
MKKLIGIIAILTIIFIYGCSKQPSSIKAKQDGKPLIVMYGDFKCPYCKKVEDKVMPKLRNKYIDKNKVKFQYVNLAFIGKDSIIGSRAQQAVNHYAPKYSLQFQKLMFEHQKDEDKKWITHTLIDKQIDKLNISNKTKDKIKTNYKTKNSTSWKAAEKDKKLGKEHHIKQTPTVFIEGKKVKDPYDFSSYQKLLEE